MPRVLAEVDEGGINMPITLEQAKLLPPFWDTPENKVRFYECFEQLQLHLRCGPGSRRQIGAVMSLLGKLSKEAKIRKEEYATRSAFISGGNDASTRLLGHRNGTVGRADDVLSADRAPAVLDGEERRVEDVAGV